MKKLLFLLLLALYATLATAEVSKIIDVPIAGTLSGLLTTAEMTSITNLTVTGNIDARDFKCMKIGITKLSFLDISSVTIQAYSGNGGPSNNSSSSSIYPANELPEGSFLSTSNLKSLIFPNSCTSIGKEAFGGSGLTNVTIPNSVTSIADYAFYNSSLTNIIISNSVKSIGDNAFYYCSQLTNVTIGNSVKSLGNNLFSNCPKLTSINIPESVTSIGDYAFIGCRNLTSITIPNSVTSIGYRTFGECGLTSVVIGNSVTSIGDYAFYYSTHITSVIIGKSVSSIGESAFCGCSELTTISVYMQTPIPLSSYVFGNVNVYACVLNVPAGRKSSYQAAPIWGDFINISEMTTDVPTLKNENINIYPNPVTNNFTIAGLNGVSNIILQDVNGKTILSKQISTNEIISTSAFPKGLYIVKLFTKEGNAIRKIVKE